MENYTVDPRGNMSNYNDKIEKMYPDVYRRLRPYVEKSASMFMGDDQLSEDKLNVMANEILLDSGLASNPPHGHTRSTLNDIAKALILIYLSQHLNGYGDSHYYLPYFYFPAFGISGYKGEPYMPHYGHMGFINNGHGGFHGGHGGFHGRRF